MTPAAREAFLIEVNTALSDAADAMGEGRPHKKAKSRATDMLGLHFKKMGRVVYVAEDMSVVYPKEASFSPDVLAVLSVPQPEDDERLAWVVADEGKGLDFVLEVLHHGDRRKDLVDNVVRYARLGIPEYFVYDRANQRVLGHRLPAGDARRYERIVPQGGRHASLVLGLDLAIQDGSLRFFVGMAELFTSEDLIARLNRMLESIEVKAEEAEARAVNAEAKVEEAKAKVEEAKARIADAEARIVEAAEKADQNLAALRTGVIAALEVRGIAWPEGARERVASCEDAAMLQRWLLRALTARAASEVLAE